MGKLSVASIILGENGQVLQLNSEAEELLVSGNGLKNSGGGLEALYASDNRELQRAMRNTFGSQQKVQLRITAYQALIRLQLLEFESSKIAMHRELGGMQLVTDRAHCSIGVLSVEQIR